MTGSVEYRSIQRFPGYRFSSDGSVEFIRSGEWHTLRASRDGNGYLLAHLRTELRRVTIRVHRLICEAFHGPCPDGMECCHFPDNDGENNSADNLRWDTKKANDADKTIHGTWPRGENCHSSKLSDMEIVKIRDQFTHGDSTYQIAKRFGVNAAAIRLIVLGVTWRHVTKGIPVAVVQGKGRRMLPIKGV